MCAILPIENIENMVHISKKTVFFSTRKASALILCIHIIVLNTRPAEEYVVDMIMKEIILFLRLILTRTKKQWIPLPFLMR